MNILSTILRQGLSLAIAGAVVGLVGALIVSNLMAGLLYGVRPRDPLTFLGVAILLMGVALLASYIPARLDKAMHEGKWEKSSAAGTEVRGKTLGLIGLGRIGSEVAIRADAFDMRVLPRINGFRRRNPKCDIACRRQRHAGLHYRWNCTGILRRASSDCRPGYVDPRRGS